MESGTWAKYEAHTHSRRHWKKLMLKYTRVIFWRLTVLNDTAMLSRNESQEKLPEISLSKSYRQVASIPCYSIEYSHR